MPTYEYACSACGKKFGVTMSFGEHDARKPACPRCKSRRVVQQISAVSTKTSRKS